MSGAHAPFAGSILFVRQRPSPSGALEWDLMKARELEDCGSWEWHWVGVGLPEEFAPGVELCAFGR